MTEYLAYERLRNAIFALGGSLEHRREGGPQGGTWVLRLGGYTLEIPCEAARFQDLDRCYRPKPGIPFPGDFGDYTNEIDPAGMARLFERLVRTSPSMAQAPTLSEAQRAELEASLTERHAVATAALKRAGYVPARWLQMVAQYKTLGACQRLLAEQDRAIWVPQLQRLWELHRLQHSVEAVACEPEFALLFTETERKIARERLKELGYEVR